MARSMTAFARNTTILTGVRYLRTALGKSPFLETSFRLPDTLRQIEMPLREIARKKLARGKIDCSIQLAFNNTDANVEADMELAQRYIDIAEKLSTELKNPAAISPLDILRWPGILKEQTVETDELLAAAKETFSVTVDQLLGAVSERGRNWPR